MVVRLLRPPRLLRKLRGELPTWGCPGHCLQPCGEVPSGVSGPPEPGQGPGTAPHSLPEGGPTLASAASPEAGSGCPMFDLVDPISRGSWRAAHSARSMPFSSWGSPTCGGHRRVSLQRAARAQARARGPHLGAGAVSLDVLQGLGGHAERLVQGAHELLLGLSRGEGHACGGEARSAPLPGPGAPTRPGQFPPCSLAPSVLVPEFRMVAYTRRARDFLVSRTTTTASARQYPSPEGRGRLRWQAGRRGARSGLGGGEEAARPGPALTRLVEGLAGALGAEHAQLHELHGGVGLQQDVDAAHKGRGALAAADGLVGVVQGQQAGGAGCVQGDAGPCGQGWSGV